MTALDTLADDLTREMTRVRNDVLTVLVHEQGWSHASLVCQSLAGGKFGLFVDDEPAMQRALAALREWKS